MQSLASEKFRFRARERQTIQRRTDLNLDCRIGTNKPRNLSETLPSPWERARDGNRGRSLSINNNESPILIICAGAHVARVVAIQYQINNSQKVAEFDRQDTIGAVSKAAQDRML